MNKGIELYRGAETPSAIWWAPVEPPLQLSDPRSNASSSVSLSNTLELS